MRSLRNLIVTVGFVLLAIAVVTLGAFPPNPTLHLVEKVLPNEKFQSH